ncbi:MAG: energy transducer TonB [Bacteroidota bacterium]|nr:energy transducer TonB [Bacteroidota bacterium]
MKTTTAYGVFELRELYQKYVIRGLLIAGTIHMMLICGYHLYTSLTNDQIEFPKRVGGSTVIIYTPPSIQNTQVVPNISVAAGTVKPSIGTPIPVPDAQIDPNTTIVENKDLTPSVGNEIGDPNGATVVIPDNGVTIENEPAPFIPVEKQPVVVNQITPVYPEIPRRAGVEGIVYVKMWVTKEGKVKKVEVVKSSSELFDQSAIAAALQWTFTPAIMNNGPVSVWVTVPFKFRLNK